MLGALERHARPRSDARARSPPSSAFLRRDAHPRSSCFRGMRPARESSSVGVSLMRPDAARTCSPVRGMIRGRSPTPRPLGRAYRRDLALDPRRRRRTSASKSAPRAAIARSSTTTASASRPPTCRDRAQPLPLRSRALRGSPRCERRRSTTRSRDRCVRQETLMIPNAMAAERARRRWRSRQRARLSGRRHALDVRLTSADLRAKMPPNFVPHHGASAVGCSSDRITALKRLLPRARAQR